MRSLQGILAPLLWAVAAARRASLLLAATIATATLHAQLEPGGNSAIRVTVSQNADGSRTAYESDPANRKAVATTTSREGKALGKILYTLDEAGRYATGEVFGAKGEFRFKTQYKYDAAGKLAEETQSTKDDQLSLKLVYAYDGNGKPAGYSVYDAAGKLVGQTRTKR